MENTLEFHSFQRESGHSGLRQGGEQWRNQVTPPSVSDSRSTGPFVPVHWF